MPLFKDRIGRPGQLLAEGIELSARQPGVVFSSHHWPTPPKPEDAPIVELMAEIGIVPGQEFDRGKLPLLGHRLDPKLALLELVHAMKDKKPVNGWLYWTSNAGQYGTDYEQRAMVTMIGPGLNFPQDALYPFSEKDADGKDYDGSKHRYVCALRRARCRR